MSKFKWEERHVDFLLDNQELTYEQIASKFNKKFNSNITPNAVRKALYRLILPVHDFNRPTMPKIAILDIETAPILAHVWGLWDNNVALNQIVSDWHLLSWAAKWYGEDEVFYQDQRDAKNIEDDREILKSVWKVLDECDILVTQNGKSFDTKKLNARFVLNGMQPPSSYRQIDTKILAKKHFGFTSNKLEYMTNKLCTKHKKLKHSKFPGHVLWSECLKGNKEAWDEMKQYNIEDILSLEELFEKLLPWDNTINFSVYNDDLKPTCSCGNQEYKESGYYYTNACMYQKYKCTKCGSEVRDKTNLLSKEKKKSLKTKTPR